MNSLVIKECDNKGDIYGNDLDAGGIIAEISDGNNINENENIIECENHGDITVTSFLSDQGGILGYIDYSGMSEVIEKCKNTGKLTVIPAPDPNFDINEPPAEFRAGGIVEFVNNASITIKNVQILERNIYH